MLTQVSSEVLLLLTYPMTGSVPSAAQKKSIFIPPINTLSQVECSLRQPASLFHQNKIEHVPRLDAFPKTRYSTHFFLKYQAITLITVYKYLTPVPMVLLPTTAEKLDLITLKS